MARTWEYLTTQSGTVLEVHRAAGGHAIASEVVTALTNWLGHVLTPS